MYPDNNRETVSSGLTRGRGGLNRLQHFIGVSDFHEPLQEKPIRYLRAHIAVLARTITLEKVLTLPTIVLDFNCGHTKGAFANWPYLLKSTKASRNFSEK
jgi:hypothetical protein